MLDTQHFSEVPAARVSQSCLSPFTATTALGSKIDEVTHGLLCPQPLPQDGSWEPAAPRQCRGSKSCRLSLGTQQEQQEQQRLRLLWLNQHAPSHVCIGQHNHQINY